MSTTPDPAAPEGVETTSEAGAAPDHTGPDAVVPDPDAAVGAPVGEEPAEPISEAAGDPVEPAPAPRTLEGKAVAPPRASYPVAGNGWLLLGLVAIVVGVVFMFLDVGLEDGTSCGTWLSATTPDDFELAKQCEDGQSQRLWMILWPAAFGVLCLVYGFVLRARSRR